MDAYLRVVQQLAKDFKSFELNKIPRGDNTTADALAAPASTFDPHLRCIILVESITIPSIKLPRGVCHRTELKDEEGNEPDSTTITNNVPMVMNKEPTSIDRRDEIQLYIADGIKKVYSDHDRLLHEMGQR